MQDFTTRNSCILLEHAVLLFAHVAHFHTIRGAIRLCKQKQGLDPTLQLVFRSVCKRVTQFLNTHITTSTAHHPRTQNKTTYIMQILEGGREQVLVGGASIGATGSEGVQRCRHAGHHGAAQMGER